MHCIKPVELLHILKMLQTQNGFQMQQMEQTDLLTEILKMDEETKKDVFKRNLWIFFIFQNFLATDE